MAGNTLKIEKTGTASFQVVRQSADKGQSRGYLEGSDRIHSESIPFRNETAYECAASTDANASLGLPHMSFAKGRMPPACNSVQCATATMASMAPRATRNLQVAGSYCAHAVPPPLKTQRKAATKTEFVVFRKAA